MKMGIRKGGTTQMPPREEYRKRPTGLSAGLDCPVDTLNDYLNNSISVKFMQVLILSFFEKLII